MSKNTAQYYYVIEELLKPNNAKLLQQRAKLFRLFGTHKNSIGFKNT